jgi:hypothetical protein
MSVIPHAGGCGRRISDSKPVLCIYPNPDSKHSKKLKKKTKIQGHTQRWG